MAYYLVHYLLGANKEYVYPKSMEGVVWKSAVYHFTEHVMVGETDEKVKADGKHINALTPTQAKELIKKCQASYPKQRNMPDPLSSSGK